MKLSEITTDRAAEVLCELTPLIDSIITDEELIASLSAAIGKEEQEQMSFGQKLLIVGAKLDKIVPILLKKRKTEMFGILGVLNEKTPEEIAKQGLIATMRQVHDIIRDRELIDFFKSCRNVDGGV